MQEFQKKLYTLHKKSWEILKDYSSLPHRDAKRAYLEILVSQVNVSYINVKINIEFSQKLPIEFNTLFQSDLTNQENYIHTLQQSLRENIIDTFLFQTELLFRFLYSKVTGITTKEKYINKVFAKLFNDKENNWQTEECNLLVLLWTLRNTIHTGGIYSDKQSYELIYKGKTYKFEQNKAPDFMTNNFTFELMIDLFDCIDTLFKSNLITDLGSIEHPNYFALNK